MKAQYKMVFNLTDDGEKEIVVSEKRGLFWVLIIVVIANGKESEYELTKRATDRLAETIAKVRKNSSWKTQKPVYFTSEGERL